jgi:hypothetical protein
MTVGELMLLTTLIVVGIAVVTSLGRAIFDHLGAIPLLALFVGAMWMLVQAHPELGAVWLDIVRPFAEVLQR